MLFERCPWYIAGPVIGVVIVCLRATVNKPLGALGGYIDVAERGARPSQLGFSAWLLAGIVLGGAAFTLFTNASVQPAYERVLPASTPIRIALLMIAGVAMGWGARIAGDAHRATD